MLPQKRKTDPINGSVSLSLARDYTLTGYATRFHLRVKASQNSISIFDTERKNKLTPEIGQEENSKSAFFSSMKLFPWRLTYAGSLFSFLIHQEVK